MNEMPIYIYVWNEIAKDQNDINQDFIMGYLDFIDELWGELATQKIEDWMML